MDRTPRSLSSWSILIGLTVACGSGGGAATEAPGDGKRAYGKLATAFCERFFACVEEHNGLRVWASVDACAQEMVSELSLTGDTSCLEAKDYTAKPADLAACISAFSEFPCALLDDSPLLYDVRVGTLEGCGPVAEQLAIEETKRIEAGAGAPGEPCASDRDCTFDAFCTASGDASCGMCRLYPGAGEPCVFREDAGRPVCRFGAICTIEGCVDHLPKAGEACGTEGECEVGLDCNDDGKCALLHAVGSACSGERASCGVWGTCSGGKCIDLPRPIAAANLPCSSGEDGEDSCKYGVCSEGKCREYPGLGEPCWEGYDCLAPYACIDDVCADVAACGSGGPGAICSTDDHCQPGHECDGARCQPLFGGAGELCDDGACEAGRCQNGICELQATDAACDASSECFSGSCAEGRCALAASACGR